MPDVPYPDLAWMEGLPRLAGLRVHDPNADARQGMPNLAALGADLWLNAPALDTHRALVEAVDNPHLRLNLDLYHAQIGEGNLIQLVERALPLVGEIQVADVPGRREPGTGEINYPFLFDHMDRCGYAGWVGCEYKPKTTTDAGLDWVRPYL